MRFAIAGGGVAGLALARAGHSAVVVERDEVCASTGPDGAFDVARKGIPHVQQPHTFLPRGRRVLRELAPDVIAALLDVGAEEQDVAATLSGARQPGDEDLVYPWVRRPVIEWALRRAAAAEPDVLLLPGRHVTGVLLGSGGVRGLLLDGGEQLAADLVVDALGRYRCPPGWPRAVAEPSDCGAMYYGRYFALADGVEHLTGPWLLNPRGDLGYLGFNTFRGDNRTFAVIFLVPTADRDLRILRDEHAWMAAAQAIIPLASMTSPSYARPITGVMPTAGLSNIDRTAGPGVPGLVPVGDALCHTDPAFALATDAARTAAWTGHPVDIGHRDGCYPLFAFAAALATAPHDDHILRRTVGRIGLLDVDRDATMTGYTLDQLTLGGTAPPLPPPPPAPAPGTYIVSPATPSR